MQFEKNIWTFWEPQENIHDYLKLCMETWKKFLPEFKINVLNYNNLDDYLGEHYFDKSLYKNYSLAKQADAIRAALLEKYGGIWLDTDTVITSDKLKKIFEINSECIMVNKHIGFIISQAHSELTKHWVQGLKKNLFIRKIFLPTKIHREILRIFNKPFLEKLNSSLYLGNDILASFFEQSDEKRFYSLNRDELYALPEFNKNQEDWNISLKEYPDIFRKFYFENDYSEYILEHEHGIIMLHNTNVPEKYKKMTKEEFLKQNNTLAALLRKLLN